MTSWPNSPTLPKHATNSHLAHYSMARSLPSMRTVASLSIFFNTIGRKPRHCCSMYLMSLIYRGINLFNEPLTTRREVLSKLMKPLIRKATAISLSETIDASPVELISVVNEFGFEGVIANAKTPFYEVREAQRRMVKIQGKQRPGICDRRLYARQSPRFSNRRLL